MSKITTTFNETGITFSDPAGLTGPAGSTITIDVNFSETVTLGDNTTLQLSNGDVTGVGSVVAGSSGDTLQFTYTVPSTPTSGELTSDLTVTGIATGSIAGPSNASLPSNSFPWTSSSGDTQQVTCFMAGTLIRTPGGDVVVESLQRGDLVLSSDGRALPVSWLGRQTVSTRFSDKLRVLPIRIKAGALDENIPARDLLVSPDHAMLVDGALIHASALVNGSSIVRETNVPQVFTYYHVEVDDHSLILAENAPAETFVDNVDRLGFDNWDEHLAFYPEGKAIEELPYPRAKAQRQVPVHTRVRLIERAQAFGATEAAVA